MSLRSESPPSPANLDFGQPPDSDQPTSAMLKADIDSGRTGDKAPHGDVGAAPLGTCEEAGGAPPTPQDVKLARTNETASERVRKAADVHGTSRWLMPALIGVLIAFPTIFGLVLWLSR